MDKGLRAAVEAAGGKAALASRLGISKQAVGQWRRVPERRVVEVARVTKVRAWVLRPDLYPAGVARALQGLVR
jgi:DNA-binding transcriptional regulator YdaS (Cro superfamily)